VISENSGAGAEKFDRDHLVVVHGLIITHDRAKIWR
jgi:hypothetical protein